MTNSGASVTKYNYYLGNDPEHWGEGCRAYGSITYENLYDGIDLHFYTSTKGLKYDLIVHEGADPSKVRFSYQGQKGMHLEDGCIFLNTGSGTITENKPIAFQNGKKVKTR
ncbi:MAG: hypothetical protein AAGC88_00590 [Bacteroidota bacterium]